MNAEVKAYAELHKVLTLQINKECFMNIKDGKQTVEHRYIYPKNAKRYVIQTENETTGLIDVETIPYDALYLINGRRKNAPRMLVEVEKAEFVVFVDENGQEHTFEEDGETYLVCQVWYHLGKVLNIGNV